MFLIVLLALLIVAWAMRGKLRRMVSPQKIAPHLFGFIALGGAGFLLLRGRLDVAAALALVAAFAFGWLRWPWARKAGQGTSFARSAMIEVELHPSGKMDGSVLAGPKIGSRLSDLEHPILMDLLKTCRQADPEGARLLEAYLDRRFPSWREYAQGYAYAGAQGSAQAGAMTKQEAYEVLGLQAGASLTDIRRAHRALIKKLHPDQGGATSLAARVNEAREVLLSRHR